jgi:hypothetical protein
LFPHIHFQTILPDAGGFLGMSDFASIPLFGNQQSGTIPYPVFYKEVETGEKVEHLFNNATISTGGGPISLHTHETLDNYTVESGKTGSLYIVLQAGSGDVQFKIWQSDSVDDVVTGSPVARYTYAGTTFDTSNKISLLDVGDFSAGKYVTIEVTSSSDSLTVVSAFIIEA